jgi:cytochrome c peroxidase
MGKTDLLEDAYRFRTPSLRNVALTAPYGHNGAYPTLDSMIRHHAGQDHWTPDMAQLPIVPWLAAADFAIREDTAEMARQNAARDLRPFAITEPEIADLVAFLNSLTGVSAETRPIGRPEAVPSGLTVD